MTKKDIYKIDNYLIKFGVLLLIIGLATTFMDPRTYNDMTLTKDGQHFQIRSFNGRSLAQVQKEVGPHTKITVLKKPVIRPLIGISGLVLLIFGISIRKKENKIISVWDALEKTSESKVRDLEVSLGLSKEFIINNLKEINAQRGAYYVYLSGRDIIVDGQLIEEHVISLQCTGCGNNINKKASLSHLDELTCTYCGAAVPVEGLAKVRSDILKENDLELKAAREKASNELHMGVFIALLLVFWPGAIIYYFIKKGSTTKNVLKSMNDLSYKANKFYD